MEPSRTALPPAPDGVAPRDRLLLPLAVLLSVAVHLGALRDGFVLDDTYVIVRNAVVTGRVPWGEVFVRDWFGFHRSQVLSIGNWRPLVTLTFRLDWALGGGAPWVFHLTNVLLHAAVTAALGWSFQRLTRRPRAAALFAALFGVHALHTEAVVSLVGRAELLLTLCAVGVCHAHASTRRASAPLAAALFVAALLSKESAVLLLGVLAAGDALIRPRAWRGLVPRYVALVACAAAAVAARRMVVGSLRGYQLSASSNPLVGAPWIEQKVTAVRLLGHATSLLLAPLELLPDYGLSVMLPSARPDPLFALGAATLAGCAALVWRSRRAPVMGVGSAWPGVAAAGFALFGAFATNLVVPILVLFAERFWYLPSAAFLFVVVERSASLARPGPRRMALAALTLWAAMLGWLTVRRTAEWRSDESLAASCVAVNERSGLCLANLGQARLARGRSGEAYALCRAATSRRPDLAPAWGCAGTALARAGHLDEAIGMFARMVQHPGAPPEYEGNYVRALLLRDRPREALERLRRIAALGLWTPQADALRREALRRLAPQTR